MEALKRISVLVGATLLAVAVASLLPVEPGFSQSSELEDEAPVLSADEALAKDARSYAEDQDISFEEGLRRMKIQNGPVGESIRRLEETLTESEKETFAGLYVQHQPEYRIIVRTVEETGAKTRILSYVDNPALRDLIQVRTAEVSLIELEGEQIEAGRIADQLVISSESYIDVMDNNVKLRVTDSNRLNSASRSGGARLPEHVEITEVEQFLPLSTDILGGLQITPPSGDYCTTGFTTVHQDGRLGITTAGHCANTMRVRGKAVPLQGTGRHYGPYDVQWHTTQGFANRIAFYDGSDRRSVQATRGRDRQAINDYVCKFGRSAGYGCGYIKGKSFQRVNADNPTRTWIYVQRASNTPTLIRLGDSGGP